MTDFKFAATLGSYLAKNYAEDFFSLLVNYQDISASEAASRLGLHIQTAQDFLEAMESLGVLSKEEVYEKKRPYYRYTLQKQRISLDLDLTKIKLNDPETKQERKIREKKNSGANLTTARNNQSISSVTIWTGNGRDQKERRISLTHPQGRFLFHLPFPNARPLSIVAIMERANVEASLSPEILDMVDLLEKYGVIETP